MTRNPGSPGFILQQRSADSRTDEVDSVAVTSHPVQLRHVTATWRKRTSASWDGGDNVGPHTSPTGTRRRPGPRALPGRGNRRRSAAAWRRTSLATSSSPRRRRESRDLSTGARCCSRPRGWSRRSCRPAACRRSAMFRQHGSTGNRCATRSRGSCVHSHIHPLNDGNNNNNIWRLADTSRLSLRRPGKQTSSSNACPWLFNG